MPFKYLFFSHVQPEQTIFSDLKEIITGGWDLEMAMLVVLGQGNRSTSNQVQSLSEKKAK